MLTELHARAGLAAKVSSHLDEFANTVLVERLEGVNREDTWKVRNASEDEKISKPSSIPLSE